MVHVTIKKAFGTIIRTPFLIYINNERRKPWREEKRKIGLWMAEVTRSTKSGVNWARFKSDGLWRMQNTITKSRPRTRASRSRTGKRESCCTRYSSGSGAKVSGFLSARLDEWYPHGSENGTGEWRQDSLPVCPAWPIHPPRAQSNNGFFHY